MQSETKTAELVAVADEVAVVENVLEGATTVAVSADAPCDSVAEGFMDAWVESRRGAGVSMSSGLMGSVKGVFGVPVLSLSQLGCTVDASHSAEKSRGPADREAKKEALIADFERKQAELKALYLTKIQELDLEPDVVAGAGYSEGSDAASRPHTRESPGLTCRHLIDHREHRGPHSYDFRCQ